jgi:hypothetical protein
VEGNCHSVEFSSVKTGALQVAGKPSVAARASSRGLAAAPGESAGWREECGGHVGFRKPKSLETSCQGAAGQVLLYCFLLDNCGTFMPLSGAQGEPRIAFVWTLFVLVFSSLSSVHFSILFTRAVFLAAVDYA